MNKKIVALAVASALAAPLAAQAEVKVSGTLQAELVSISGDAAGSPEGLHLTDAQEGGAAGSGNAGEIAFSASEDLGGGLKAIAKYGMNVNVGGSSARGTRDSYIGLSGGFGTVLLGRLSSPYKSSTVKWDPFLATSFQARGNSGMSGLHNSYVDDVIAYANKFGTATVVAAISLDEANDNGDTNGKHAFTASVNAPVGPVELALAYIDVSEYGEGPELGIGLPAGAAPNDTSAFKVGVKWTSGAVTAAGQYEAIEIGGAEMDVVYLTGSYNMGANTLSASFGQTSPDGGDDETYFALGATHAFSKTTKAYVGYTSTDLDAAGDYSVFGAGMRVSF